MKTLLLYFSIYIVIAFAFGAYIEYKIQYKVKSFADYFLRILIGLFWPLALFFIVMAPEVFLHFSKEPKQLDNNQESSNE